MDDIRSDGSPLFPDGKSISRDGRVKGARTPFHRGIPGLAKGKSDFTLLFLVMLTVAAGSTGLQSVLPAVGRLFGVPDLVVALTFSFSALAWSLSASFWARRSDRKGRRRMVITGLVGFTISTLLCALALSAGIAGWLSVTLSFAMFVLSRMVYGVFGSATPPAAQAMIASRTSRAERTNALAMLASAFGLGTILGPALAPFFVAPPFGLAGPAYAFALFGLGATIVAIRLLPEDRPGVIAHGRPTSEPSIGGEPNGTAYIEPIVAQSPGRLALRDPRLWPWMMVGLVAGHAQAMAGQAMGFLIIDRLELAPLAAQPVIGLTLMAGAGAALLAQWGVIPRLGLGPRALVLWGSLIAGLGCAAIAIADGMHALTVAFALASLGFGFIRPGFTAGASLAVGTREQGAVAGRVTAVSGAVFVVGPAIGIGLYEIAAPLPYLVSAVALAGIAAYAARTLTPSPRAG